MNTPSDEEFIARSRRRFKESLLVSLLFGLGMAGLIILHFVLQYRPEMTSKILIAIMCGGAVIPASYFVILDWRAGR